MTDSIDKLIKAKTFPAVLLMFGEEDFLIDESYDKLVKHLMNGITSTYDFEVIDAGEASPERIVDSCVAYPFVSEKRTIVVKHFEKLVPQSKKKDDKNPVLKYMLDPQPTTLLILIAEADSLYGLHASQKNPKQSEKAKKIIASAHPIYKTILEKHEWIEFPKVYESDFPAWVNKRFKENGREITPDACELLIRQTNPSLRDISNEIEKILLYVQDKKSVTLDDVAFIAGTSRVNNVFELQKAIGKRNLNETLLIIANMLKAERQEMLIMTMLTRYFLTLWKLLEESVKTNNQYQLAGIAGISPFFVPEYLEALRKYSPAELDMAFVHLAAADETLKSSSTDSIFVLQDMMIKIMEKHA